MKKAPAELIRNIQELVQALPEEENDYLSLSRNTRRQLRDALIQSIHKLEKLSGLVDPIRLPVHVFDLNDPVVVGRLVANTLLEQPKISLHAVAENGFYGAGVYALYYSGDFDAYGPISGKPHPIYVGKADPAAHNAKSPHAQGTKLHTRLCEHAKSIRAAQNLNIEHFHAQYLVVTSTWVGTAEQHLIRHFLPIWNSEVKVCFGFGKHGDSAHTRSNQRSPWDTLHPGRRWATHDGNKPNTRSIEQIKADISGHFVKHPPVR